MIDLLRFGRKAEASLMPYGATVYGVMIASPSDCASERSVVKSVIDDWNASHSRFRRMVLEPRGWDTHSAPELGDRPQAIINKKVVEDCDLLIATFWTRLGTPTGAAPSGTAEEIGEHVAAGKPAMIYVSTAPVAPASIDQEQYAQLQSILSQYRQQGLVESYDSLVDFRQKLTRQLARVVNERFTASVTNNVLSDAALDAAGFQARNVVAELGLGIEAIELLHEAIKDTTGTIMMLRHMTGTVLQTNGRQFITDNSARTVAKWKAALDELRTTGCIEDRGHKGEVFAVTNRGYDIADQLALSA